MKKLLISIFAIAAMVSCTSENEIIDNGGKNDEKVEIKLNGGVSAIETKATVGSNSDVTGVCFLRYNINTIADYSAPTKAITGASINGTTHAITLPDEDKYYTADETNSHFIGYYPAGTVTKNVVEIDINGHNDILASEPFDAGNRLTPTTNGSISFKHKLTQLEFKIKGTASDATYFGNVEYIKIANQHPTATLTLAATPTITGKGTLTDIAVQQNDADAPAMSIPTAEDVFGYALILPQAGTLENGKKVHEFNLKVKTANTNEQNITVKVSSSQPDSPAAGEGIKNIITLTFSQKGVEATSSIDDWSDSNGGTGSGTVN